MFEAASPNSTDRAVAGVPGRLAHEAAKADTPVTQLPPYFIEALEDAERLLKYAAEIGVSVDDNTRSSVLEARAAVSAGWNQKMQPTFWPRSPSLRPNSSRLPPRACATSTRGLPFAPIGSSQSAWQY